jgi:hypothetical protein
MVKTGAVHPANNERMYLERKGAEGAGYTISADANEAALTIRTG